MFVSFAVYINSKYNKKKFKFNQSLFKSFVNAKCYAARRLVWKHHPELVESGEVRAKLSKNVKNPNKKPTTKKTEGRRNPKNSSRIARSDQRHQAHRSERSNSVERKSTHQDNTQSKKNNNNYKRRSHEEMELDFTPNHKKIAGKRGRQGEERKKTEDAYENSSSQRKGHGKKGREDSEEHSRRDEERLSRRDDWEGSRDGDRSRRYQDGNFRRTVEHNDVKRRKMYRSPNSSGKFMKTSTPQDTSFDAQKRKSSDFEGRNLVGNKRPRPEHDVSFFSRHGIFCELNEF